jgi:hypothetical protein
MDGVIYNMITHQISTNTNIRTSDSISNNTSFGTSDNISDNNNTLTSDNTCDNKHNVGKKPIFERVVGRLDDLVNYASQGLDNKVISELLGISESSFYRLLSSNREFRQAYEKGVEASKYQLEKALFKRAEGFNTQEIKYEKDAEGNIIKQTITEKNYVPDTTALIFALKNIYGEKYKDKIEQVNTFNINIKQIQNMSDEELLLYAGNLDIPIDFEIE